MTGEGKMLGTVYAESDMTETEGLLRENARLRESIAELEAAQQASQLKEELIAGVSHDLQTPLAVLYGIVQTLVSGKELPDEGRRDLYEAMLRQTIRVRHLLGQFLDYARIEAGSSLTFNPAPTDIRTSVELVTRTFAHANPIEIDLPPGLPPALVDSDRLMQVLANLISNAVKFSPTGSPIRITGGEAGEAIELAVTDQGSGMSELVLANAFEKFFRAGTAEGKPGNGLGLYLSREIVEGQGGTIAATSHVGEGSRFVLRLPKAIRLKGGRNEGLHRR